ncbi:MAG: hypothetical protein ACSHYB_10695 [Roseibacillus sp.]
MLKRSAKNMTMTRRQIIASALTFVLVCGSVIGWNTYQLFRAFTVEDEIHSSYWTVLKALDEYEVDNDSPPSELGDLVPDYLLALPVSESVTRLEYKVASSGTGWRLLLNSIATGSPRIYLAHQNMALSEDELQDVVGVYHDRWSIIEGETAELLVRSLELK